MRDQRDSRTLPLPLTKPVSKPFIVHHGERLIGVYWAHNVKQAAGDARAESRSFGPIDLSGKRLTVELHAAAYA